MGGKIRHFDNYNLSAFTLSLRVNNKRKDYGQQILVTSEKKVQGKSRREYIKQGSTQNKGEIRKI